MYTIGQISEMFEIPISTLRYYDKEGFFPNMTRKGNTRYFGDQEIEIIRIIKCLKKTNLEIKEIATFIEWLSEGSTSYRKRKALFENRRAFVKQEIEELQKTLSLLEYKCWYYDQAIKDGNEERIKSLLPDHLPADIQVLYDHFYSIKND